MKKLTALLLAAALSLSLAACSKPSPTTTLKDKVEFKLSDALRVKNNTTNTVYYYFLGSVQNDSNEGYALDSLSYAVTDDDHQDIHAIDSEKVTITKTVQPGQDTFVYGSFGYPDSGQKNMGLWFPKTESFIPFKSVDVREITDKNVHYSDENKFTLYDDKYFMIEVDASDCQYAYSNGNSYINGLIITYTNKTNERIVVPYIHPEGKMTGVKVSEIETDKDLEKMNTEEIQKVDLTKNDMAPRTKLYQGEATGYQCFYLGASQSLPCNISFVFGDVIPDFSDKDGKAVEVDLNQPALGYSQQIFVSY